MRNALILSILATVLLGAASVAAQATAPSGTAATAAPAGVPAAKAPAKADDVEEIDDVKEVTPPPAAADARPGEVPSPWAPRSFIGALHPAVVHLPIGWMVMVLLIDLGAFLLSRKEFESFGPWALGATVVSFVPGLITGLVREGTRVGQVAEGPAREELVRLVATHETLILVSAGLATLALVVRLALRNRLDGAVRGVYLTLVGAATVLVAVAGHWGGKISGTNSLPF